MCTFKILNRNVRTIFLEHVLFFELCLKSNTQSNYLFMEARRAFGFVIWPYCFGSWYVLSMPRINFKCLVDFAFCIF